MENKKTALIGLMLPLLPLGVSLLLVVISFLSHTAAAVIAADKLILLTAIVLSPIIYICGAAVSIMALFRTEMKVTAALAAALNIVLLISLLYFSKPVLMEFEFYE